MTYMQKKLRLGAWITGSFFALSLLLPVPAGAHAAYDGSNPPDEGTVSSPPAEVWAEFTEPPAEGSTLQIVDPCGQRVDAGDYRYFGYRVTVSMSADKQGTYSANWHVVSDLDSHPTSGTFTFTSTGGEACPGSEGGGSSGGGSSKPSGGGGDGGGGGGSSSAGDGSGQTEDGGDVVAAGTSSTDSAKESSGPAKKHKKHKKHKTKSDKKPAPRRADGIDLVADVPQPEPRPEEMPVGWLLGSFGIAGLIGATGGLVYVSIIRR